MIARPRPAQEEPDPGSAAEDAASIDSPEAAADAAGRGPLKARSLVLAVALGVLAGALARLELPVITEEAPFRLLVVPLLLAFVLLGERLALVASAVALALAALGGGAQVLGDALHVLEAWAAARLFPRVHSLAFAVVLFWCTAGAAADALGYGLLKDHSLSSLVPLFAAQLFSGVVAAFIVEGLLQLLPGRPVVRHHRTELRHYFFSWAMWLVMLPVLILALTFGRFGYRQQTMRARADAQRLAEQVAADVTEAVEDHGHQLEKIAAVVDGSRDERGGVPPAELDRLRAEHPAFTTLVIRDPAGRVAASSPGFVGSAPQRPGAASGDRYSVALERETREGAPAALAFMVPLAAGERRPEGTITGTVEAGFLDTLLGQRRAGAADVLSLATADGALVASTAGSAPPLDGDAPRDTVRQPLGWLHWVVDLQRPLSDVQRAGRDGLLRVLSSFLALMGLLQFATFVLARKVAAPLARIDGAAGALEAGGVGADALLGDLAGSPIAEVHRLATRFARMHEALTYHDALTGLPNEKLLLDRLSVAAAQAAEPPSSFTLLLVDLDRFRVIDSTLGHTLGNEVLRKVGRRLQDCVRIGDTVARVGGDEFALLLPRVGRMEDATDIALKVMDAVKRPFLVAGQDVFVTATVGISLYPRDGLEPETLLKNAVSAAYVAKEQGQDTYRRYTARIKVRDAQRLLIETGLRRALENGGLFLQYQPIVDLRNGAVLAAEALVRWRREDAGVVEAAGFIPVAEASGLITAIDLWVMRAACAQAAAWRDAGRELRVAINLSGREVQEPDMVDQVRHALDLAGLEPRLLEIEITEGVALRDVERCADVLSQLRELGLSIAVDDFGTGYSSLSYLRRLPVDRVKLDRSFVQDITRNADDAAIATAVIAMTHGLRLTVVAEGVETEEQLAFLRSHDCDAMQGRLFSPPVSSEDLETLLDRNRRAFPG